MPEKPSLSKVFHTFESIDDATLRALDIQSGGATSIVSHQGKVILATDKVIHLFHRQKSGKNSFWQSNQDKGLIYGQAIMTNIRAQGDVNLSGGSGISWVFNSCESSSSVSCEQ